MKLDKKLLRETIKRTVALQRKTNSADLATYATYLYCLATHRRHQLHMQWWNKLHPERVDIKNVQVARYKWPYQFGVDFKSLEDQAAFIAQVKERLRFLQDHCKKYTPENEFCKLPLDFEIADEPASASLPEVAQ